MTQQIGQYRLIEELGAGGMGIVYRALDTDLQREVALKRLRSEFAASVEVLERFRNEAKLQGRLNHPNIAQLYSLVQTQDAFCIVMELVNGIVVKELLALEWELAIAVIIETLDAIGFAHDLGVLHRDIKPENIIIDQRGTVKVMDFGIAYAVGSQRMTREKSILGTLEYMSPERILSKPMDGRSDVYSLGILLFELLSAKLPFDTASEYDLLRWHLEDNAPPVSGIAKVPAFFDSVIEKAMRKDPAARYASCAEMAADLRAFAPMSEQATERLRALVAQRMRNTKPAAFDERRCFELAAQTLVRGDVSSAERMLRQELNRHPRMVSLRQYHEVVLRAETEMAAAGLVGRDQERIKSWLRLISMERAMDTRGFEREIKLMHDGFPGEAPAELLRSGLAGNVQDGVSRHER